MRFRITESSDEGITVLHVDGELVGAGVRELERVAGVNRPMRLDLTHLLRADTHGLATLRRLAAAGVELANLPPYFELLLANRRGRPKSLK